MKVISASGVDFLGAKVMKLGEVQVALKSKTLVWILGLAGLISAADNWIVSPVLPAIAEDFEVSIAQAGAVLTAYMIPYGAMQPVYGFLSDRRGKAKTLQWTVCGLAFGTIGCVFADSLIMLCIWRAVTGFFAAGIIAVSLALIGDNVAVSERQNHVGKFMGIVFLGQGLSVGLGGVFAKYISWRMAFVFFAIAAIGNMFLLQELPRESLNFVQQHNFFSEVKRVLLTKKGRVIFPLALATGFLLLGLYSFLGSFLHDVAGLDYLQVGVVVMFYGFACLAAGTRVGKLGQRFGWQRTVISGGYLALATVLLLAIFPCWQAGWLATVSLGFGYIFIQSTLATLAFDVATESKGLPSALIGLGLFGGGGLGTAFSSWLLGYGGYQTIWIVFGVGIVFFTVIVARVRLN